MHSQLALTERASLNLAPLILLDPVLSRFTAVWTWIDRCNESLLFPSPDNDRGPLRVRTAVCDLGQGAGCLFAEYQISFSIDTAVV